MAFPDGIADFRSDTVTHPTAAMRKAMAEADVGDDVYGEDPTVNQLEAEAADALGAEAAMFVPAGTMGNQLSLAIHTRPGQEVFCPVRAHIRSSEHGAASAWSGVSFRALGDARGSIEVAELEEALGEAGDFRPPAGLLTWEISHNFAGGTIVPIEVVEATGASARAAGLKVHLDGARLWNAVVAEEVPAARYAAAADSVMFCFSKGLGAPVGSVVCGGGDFVAEARRLRKRMGGAMRQAGVLAAPALIAFRERDRLFEDHALARALGEGLADRFPDAIDLDAVVTNMVIVDEAALGLDPGALVGGLKGEGILAGYNAPGRIRFVTHRDVDRHDVQRVLAVIDSL